MRATFLARLAPALIFLAALGTATPLSKPLEVARAAELCVVGGGVGVATPATGSVRIHDIQGNGHVSPCLGQDVVEVPGVVTAIDGGLFWMQDPEPDADDATSEGILVFVGDELQFLDEGEPRPLEEGDGVRVSGTVAEFLPGGEGANLATTEIVDVTAIVADPGLGPVEPVLLGPGGRMAPTEVIDDDGGASPGAAFEPAIDGLDFWESLEGMLVRVEDALVAGYRLRFGELPVVAAGGVGATGVTPRGGIAVGGGPAGPDLNPELAFLDDDLLSGPDRFPTVDTGARVTSPVEGVVDYARRRYRILPDEPVAIAPSTLLPEQATPAGADELAIASFNVLNFHPGATDRSAALANVIVHNLAAPDLVVLQEVQDNSGPADDGVTDADETYGALIGAIAAAGGPTYAFQDVPPADGASGGEPGGNIRVGFLYRTDRGLAFVPRDGDPAAGVEVLAGPELSVSPGPVLADAAHPDAFLESRLPLAGEFTYNGHTLFVIGNHFASRGGSSALYGSTQPPEEGGREQRLAQAEVVAALVEHLLAEDADALVAVVGDFNDFYASAPLETLEGAGRANLTETLAGGERYTYVFEGNSQAIDHVLVSPALLDTLVRGGYDAVHAHAEFYDPVNADDPAAANPPSDHDPVVARFALPAT